MSSAQSKSIYPLFSYYELLHTDCEGTPSVLMKFRGKLMIRVGQIARDVSDVSSDSKWIIEVTGIDKCPRTISDSLEQ